jgi:hypothetical protein
LELLLAVNTGSRLRTIDLLNLMSRLGEIIEVDTSHKEVSDIFNLTVDSLYHLRAFCSELDAKVYSPDHSMKCYVKLACIRKYFTETSSSDVLIDVLNTHRPAICYIRGIKNSDFNSYLGVANYFIFYSQKYFGNYSENPESEKSITPLVLFTYAIEAFLNFNETAWKKTF